MTELVTYPICGKLIGPFIPPQWLTMITNGYLRWALKEYPVICKLNMRPLLIILWLNTKRDGKTLLRSLLKTLLRALHIVIGHFIDLKLVTMFIPGWARVNSDEWKGAFRPHKKSSSCRGTGNADARWLFTFWSYYLYAVPVESPSLCSYVAKPL